MSLNKKKILQARLVSVEDRIPPVDRIADMTGYHEGTKATIGCWGVIPGPNPTMIWGRYLIWKDEEEPKAVFEDGYGMSCANHWLEGVDFVELAALFETHPEPREVQ